MTVPTDERHDSGMLLRVLVAGAIASSLLGESATTLSLPLWLGPALVLAILLARSRLLRRQGSPRARAVVLSISALAGVSLAASLWGPAA